MVVDTRWQIVNESNPILPLHDRQTIFAAYLLLPYEFEIPLMAAKPVYNSLSDHDTNPFPSIRSRAIALDDRSRYSPSDG